jgi:hypothetical protein
MAILIVQSEDGLSAGVFHNRVVIGRKPFNGVQLEHRTISRIHAWIDKIDGHFRICNASARGCTIVNGQKITSGVQLHDGDRITIGTATLVYRDGDQIPDGAITFDISDKGANPDYQDDGILFHCQCGAPLWVPAAMAGAYGKCAHCKGDITIPGSPLTGVRRPLSPNDSIVDEPAIKDLGSAERPDDPLAAEPVPVARKASPAAYASGPRPKPPRSRPTCSVCQSEILAVDPTTTCAACSQTYHTECWMSNRGCAAYGCSQVGILEPEPVYSPDADVLAQAKSSASDLPVKPPFPWDFAFLGGSVVGSIVGAFTFGVPALAVGGAAAIYAIRRGGGKARVAALSVVICAVGVAVGVMTSRCWWFNAPLWTWGKQ